MSSPFANQNPFQQPIVPAQHHQPPPGTILHFANIGPKHSSCRYLSFSASLFSIEHQNPTNSSRSGGHETCLPSSHSETSLGGSRRKTWRYRTSPYPVPSGSLSTVSCCSKLPPEQRIRPLLWCGTLSALSDIGLKGLRGKMTTTVRVPIYS